MAAAEVRKSYVSGPLKGGYPSLFASDSEEEGSSEGLSDGEEPARPSLLPLDEAIKETPQNLATLLEVLLPRLQPRAEVRGVALEDQQDFASILMGELASQFSVLQHQVDDPFLSQHQNKQLHRQIVIQVCKIVEELYAQYIAKASRLSEESVFSLAANLSRLRAQLTLQANRSFNIPVIRRQVLSQLRGPLPTKPSRLPPIPRQHVGQRRKKTPGTKLEDLALDEPLKAKLARFGLTLRSGTIRRRVRKLKARIPKLISTEMESESDSDVDIPLTQRSESHSPLTKGRTGLCRVPSLPELWGNFLLCDLGLTTRRPHHPTQHHLTRQQNHPAQHHLTQTAPSKQRLLGVQKAPSVESLLDLQLDVTEAASQSDSIHLGEYALHDLSDDLKQLSSQRPSLDLASGMEDLHPLLQAHVHGLSEKGARRLAEFDSKMRASGSGRNVRKKERPDSGCGFLEHSIPSVPTLEQLPYLTIQHASGPTSPSPHPIHIKSGTSLLQSASNAPSSMTGFGSSSFFPDDSIAGAGSDRTEEGVSMPQVDGSKLLLGSRIGVSSDGQQQSGTRCDLLGASLLESSFLGSSAPEVTGGLLQEPLCSGVELQIRDVDRRVGPSHVDVGCIDVSNVSLLQSQEYLEESCIASNVLLDSAFSLNSSGDVPEVGTQPQPAVITTRVNDQEVIRTSDIRVSERTPLISLRLKPFGPIYNEITGELDSAMLKELDSNLNEGKEISAVYQEIMKTLPAEHLQFDKEPTLEPCLEQSVDLTTILASETLQHRQSCRIANPHLHRPISPPWGEESKNQWEKSNQYQGPDLKQLGISMGSAPLSPEAARLTRVYTTWLGWWRSTVNSQDFLKFASKEESDYLHLVYHLYDSEGSDSEAEQEERERRERLAKLHAKLKAKQAKRDRLYQQKGCYVNGMWNVNSVMMGGLGGDPEIPSSEEEDNRSEDLHAKVISAAPDMLQQRLQQVWARLHVSENQRVDMAIKYSSHQFENQLSETLEVWEKVCDLIEKREVFLFRLEAFEKKASDPGRFFAKGQHGSSATRLEEARMRDRLHKELDNLDKNVSQATRMLQSRFGDVVTYKGRPYHEKMSSDRTEMLYWLQQERRQTVLRPAIRTLNSKVTIPQPPPATRT